MQFSVLRPRIHSEEYTASVLKACLKMRHYVVLHVGTHALWHRKGQCNLQTTCDYFITV